MIEGRLCVQAQVGPLLFLVGVAPLYVVDFRLSLLMMDYFEHCEGRRTSDYENHTSTIDREE